MTQNEKKGKILFAGNFEYKFREFAMAKALNDLGWQIDYFSWKDYKPNSFLIKILFKYLIGPTIKKINSDLLKKCKEIKPDIVFLYRPLHIRPKTIKRIKQYCRLITTWNPDNVFGGYNYKSAWQYKPTGKYRLLAPIIWCEKTLFFKRIWINVLKSLPLYDFCFVYRAENIAKYKEAGAKEVYHLPSFYDPQTHRPVALSKEEQGIFNSDVIFIGHYEPDERMEYIEALLDNEIKVKLKGEGWDPYLSLKLKKTFGSKIQPVFGENYIKTISGTKIALCFLSKLNKNQYTRRCFEIPACQTFLLCERTEILKQLYEEDKEAVYFSNKGELITKTKYYLSHPEDREKIALAGYQRCISSGYDVKNRMKICDKIFTAKLNPTKSLS